MIAVLAVATLVALASSASSPARPLLPGARASLTRGAATVGAPDAKSYLHMRADLNQVRLDRLTAAVDRAEGDFGSYTDQHDDHAVDHLEERVTKLTGASCDVRQFQCGGEVPRCISNLLVCDGSADCDNGHDEDSSVCVNVFTEGSSWSWTVDWGTCTRQEYPPTGMMLVSKVMKSKYFPSHVKIDLTIPDADGNGALTEDGRWSYGARKLLIYPAVQGFPLCYCNFEKGVDDHCEGPMVFIDTLEKCGSIVMKKYK